ncbi:inter-alpha-trypsin inhibitor heavy chain H3-like isoform X2 [Denticeps clupeoides]|uniref:inter-alpha-trypsin inhibitor heavy chain H3-like isoform X2 n=1 Tax=Denticeps clupeoides TaxID=299321 RepID=UPI0010A44EB8|nr:inter-alpha-trypsin inhibitor heavy chain H3-like isoform X2 [Denticeps clupeoides]
MSGVLLRLLLGVWVCSPAISHGALLVSRDGEAQGQVVVQSVKVDCKVAFRFAHTVMTSTALNKGNSSQEVVFEVDLPKTAFITNFSMEIEEVVYVGEVKEKEKAKKQYEKAAASGQTAGLVKASGRKLEKFTVSVNIAAFSNVTFTLTYEELLKRRQGKYEIMIRVKPKQLIQHFEIVADIYEPQGIAFLDASGTFISNELLPLVEKKVADKKAHVSFSPTLDQQRTCPDCEGTLIDGDFFIKYDVNRPESFGDIQIVNGYFVHFFAPAGLHRVPKNIVLVIDISSSMVGHKIRQTRDALLTILTDLHEDDHFGLVLFDDRIEPWRPTLSRASEGNVTAAKDFVKTIKARSLTNINDAVLKAVEMLHSDLQLQLLPEQSLSMIILLTDGHPSSGETNTEKIQENVRAAIGGNMTLFCLGFGYDLDYAFLDVMAKQNDGAARRIYEASDAALQLQGFYDEVATPLLSEVHMIYPDGLVNSVTENHFRQLFNGSEIVVAGRLSESDLDNFLVEISAQGYAVQGQVSAHEWDVVFPDEEYVFGDFTERLWAYLTIEQLLDKREKGSPEEKENATAEALSLSLQYSFVTPLTSMVVTKPEDEANSTLIADKLTEDQRQRLRGEHGFVGASQRHSRPTAYMGYRKMSSPATLVDGDPHFIIELPAKNDALCFNVDNKPDTIFNLVNDPVLGIVVNGRIIGDKKVSPGGKMNTYFGSFGIMYPKLGIRLMVSTQEISVFHSSKLVKLMWSDSASIKGLNMDLQVAKDHLTISLRDSIKFVIILHKVWEKHPYHQDYLGFYTIDSHLFSTRVHGLLGQFYHGVQFEVGELHAGKDANKPDATMWVKGHKVTVTRGQQRDFRRDVKDGELVMCWFVHNNGTGLIDGTLEDYVVSGLFKTI